MILRDEDEDVMDGAKGLVRGVLCGFGIWFLIGMAAYWVWR
jgi:hypothetical protein